jgi:hypothetical protein
MAWKKVVAGMIWKKKEEEEEERKRGKGWKEQTNERKELLRRNRNGEDEGKGGL